MATSTKPPADKASSANTSPAFPILSSIADFTSGEPYKPLISPSIYHATEEGKSRPGVPLANQADLLIGRYADQLALESVRTSGEVAHERADPFEAAAIGADERAKGHFEGGRTELKGSSSGSIHSTGHDPIMRPRNDADLNLDLDDTENGGGSGALERGGEATRERKKKLVVKGLMDAPARAALNLPNGHTSHLQAAAVRNAHPAMMTPEFEITPSAALGLIASTVPLPRSLFGGKPPPDTDLEGDFGVVGGSEGVAYASSFSVGASGGIGVGGKLLGSGGRGQGELGDYFARLGGGSGSAGGSGGRQMNGTEWAGDGETSRAGSRSPSPGFGSSFTPGGIRSTLLKRIRIDRSSSPNQHLLRPTFPPPSLSTYSPRPPRALTLLEWANLYLMQTASFVVSTSFLVIVVIWAVSMEFATQVPRWLRGQGKKKVFPWDDEKYWKKHGRVSKEPRDYARAIGMDIEDQTVETEDGFYLRVNKVIDPDARKKSDGRGGFPVLILHGLFQSSGSFITSEERSLAFWLAKQGGYQVYLGNTRGVYGMGHRNLSKSDPRFWDWTIRELAMYDLPALVEHVCAETGYEKIAFIGHSQGNGLAFISLSVGMCPSLGKRLSLFVALAPAVYAGPLTSGFPFTQLGKMEWQTWKRLFGVLDFIPLMRWSYDHVPARMFAALGYVMFAYLFNWTDTNWLKRRKVHMFRFTPTPVSSASLFWWCGKGGFGSRKCTMDDTLDTWYDNRFPPLSIYYGGRDYLVLTEPLLDRLKNKEKGVEIVRVQKLDVGEHCDFYWSAEAVEWVFHNLRDDIEKTRLRYPEELSEESAEI